MERVILDAPEGEPLRLELESFVGALKGEGPVAVSGHDGREALAVALRIVGEIERSGHATSPVAHSGLDLPARA